MDKLLGKTAIVTGSGRGIGRAIALKLGAEGANVVINDLDQVPADENSRRTGFDGRPGTCRQRRRYRSEVRGSRRRRHSFGVRWH